MRMYIEMYIYKHKYILYTLRVWAAASFSLYV